MSKRAMIIGLFLAVPLSVPALAVVREGIAEPFPAPFFPTFGYAPEQRDSYRVTTSVLRLELESGGSRAFKGRRLTEDSGVAPEFVLRSLAYEGLGPSGTVVGGRPYPSSVRWLLGRHAGRAEDDRAPLLDAPDMQAWLRRRVKRLVPGNETSVAVLEWRSLWIDRSNGRVRSQHVDKVIRLFPR